MPGTARFSMLLPLLLTIRPVPACADEDLAKPPIISEEKTRISPHAHIVSTRIDDERRAYGTGPLHIVYSDGQTVTVSSPPESKDVHLRIVGFTEPKIADDGRTIGWVEEVTWCCASYPLPHTVDIFSPDRPLLRLPVQSMVYGYKFLPGLRQLVLHWGFPHGGNPEYWEFYDLASGRQKAQISSDVDDPKSTNWHMPADAPDWVKNFGPD